MLVRQYFLLSFFILVCSDCLYSQNTADEKDPRLQVALNYRYALTKSGYVQVREDAFTGTKLPFSENKLDMDQSIQIGLSGTYTLKDNNRLFAHFERYFFVNDGSFNSDVWFNGTHLDASKGLDIDHTKLYHATAGYTFTTDRDRFYIPDISVGLIYDGLIFNVEGVSLSDSYRFEQSEKFIRQCLPYPFAGLHFSKSVSARAYFSLNAEGTYIPAYKSFFHEGGTISIQYSSSDISAGYHMVLGRFNLSASLFYGSTTIHQESEEDSNDFSLQVSGLELACGFIF